MCTVALLHIFPRYSICAARSATYMGNGRLYAEQAYGRRHKDALNQASVRGRWGKVDGSKHASVA